MRQLGGARAMIRSMGMALGRAGGPFARAASRVRPACKDLLLAFVHAVWPGSIDHSGSSPTTIAPPSHGHGVQCRGTRPGQDPASSGTRVLPTTGSSRYRAASRPTRGGIGCFPRVLRPASALTPRYLALCSSSTDAGIGVLHRSRPTRLWPSYSWNAWKHASALRW